MKKVLIIQTAFIGDVILSTPLIRAISELTTVQTVDVLVRKGNGSLLRNFPGISQVIEWDKQTSKFVGLLRELKRIRRERYDTIINLQRFLATGLLTGLSGAPERIGFDKNPVSFLFTQRKPHQIGDGCHETERNLSLIGLSKETTSIRPELHPSQTDFASAQDFKTGSYSCIAPCSVWFTKQVPSDKWLKLIQNISSSRKEELIYLLGGPDDSSTCEAIRTASKNPRVISLAGKLSFLQTAALMQDARMNYVNDSAPLHIASAMNAPVTAFFCSTVPEFGFGPLSDHANLREVNGLACRPCGLHGHLSCPKTHFRCANELDMQS